MKKLTQSIVDPKRGNCLQICVAMLLQLPIGEVPHFIELGESWFNHPTKGLLNYPETVGYEYLGKQEPIKAVALSKGVDGYFIGVVDSINFKGVTHVCIFKDLELWHDPSPAKQWGGSIEDVKYFYMIERK